jgi:hypothetical protein
MALMVSVHQLGALLAVIVAVPIALTWPGRVRVRVAVLAAMVAGVALSTTWIYFNPIEAVILDGNPTWKHGVQFYSLKLLSGIFIPSAVGIIGLARSQYGGPGKPLLIAFALSLAAFVSGAFGILIATRFAPLMVMLLQIGIASQLVSILENPAHYSDRFKQWAGVGVYAVLLFETVVLGVSMFPEQVRWERQFGNAMTEASVLTADIPDDQQVAAYDAAAYPVAATGQKVLSVPWPEPFISDLSSRQQKVEQLFDWRLSRQQRVALAKKYGVRTLILDDRYGPLDEPREWKAQQLRIFLSQSVGTWHSGPMWRFDLY